MTSNSERRRANNVVGSHAHRTRRSVLIVMASMIAIMLGVVLSEAALAAYVWATRGELVWLRSVSSQRPNPPMPERGTLSTFQVLNPYFGFTMRPGWSWRGSDDSYFRINLGYTSRPKYMDFAANAHGFLSDREYPYQAEPNDFVVGIFGGSVAFFLALDGHDAIVTALRANPALSDKNIVILNMAGGGFKQPQQSLILSYFQMLGQRFDLVINMDGFNEGFMAWENHRSGVATDMPPSRFIYGLQNMLVSTEPLYQAARVKREAEIEDWAQRNTRSTIIHFYHKWRHQSLKFEEARLEVESGAAVPGRPYVVNLPRAHGDWLTDGVSSVTGAWTRGSIQMHDLVRATGGHYIHILQPSPYFGSRGFPEVASGRIPPATEPYVDEIVGPVYRSHLAASRALIERGINFINATEVFDDQTDPIYYDNCFHFNLRGYALLIERILAPTLNTIAPQPR